MYNFIRLIYMGFVITPIYWEQEYQVSDREKFTLIFLWGYSY